MMSHCLKRAVLILLASAGALSAADTVVGTWVLNLRKSVYRPGPAPRNQTRVYREGAAGIIATVVTTLANGKSTTVEFEVNYDGQVHPVSGSEEFDAIKMTRINNDRSESQLLHAGRVIAKTVRLVANDGKTLTITYEGVASDGAAVRNTLVYDKQ